jgi:hypothetical protein
MGRANREESANVRRAKEEKTRMKDVDGTNNHPEMEMGNDILISD